MDTFLLVTDAILLVIILSFLCPRLWNKYQAKRVGGALSSEEFRAGIRKAQIIDIRESAPSKRKHINGARNIPMAVSKYQHGEIRKDLSACLYSDASSITLRAAGILRKDGHKEISRLKDGLENWDGHTKASRH